MVPVKVKLPLEALGIETVPVETVMVPEFDNVVTTVKLFAPTANVALELTVKVPPERSVILLLKLTLAEVLEIVRL